MPGTYTSRGGSDVKSYSCSRAQLGSADGDGRISQVLEWPILQREGTEDDSQVLCHSTPYPTYRLIFLTEMPIIACKLDFSFPLPMEKAAAGLESIR